MDENLNKVTWRVKCSWYTWPMRCWVFVLRHLLNSALVRFPQAVIDGPAATDVNIELASCIIHGMAGHLIMIMIILIGFHVDMFLTPKTLKYYYINHGDPRDFFQFQNIIIVLVSSFRFIWTPMLWVYGHYKCNSYRAGSTLDVYRL